MTGKQGVFALNHAKEFLLQGFAADKMVLAHCEDERGVGSQIGRGEGRINRDEDSALEVLVAEHLPETNGVKSTCEELQES